MAGKTLGRSSGSLNAPIAAFTMALLLGSYCIKSIHTARREAQSTSSTTTTTPRPRKAESQSSWVQQALEESREGEKKGSQ
ncbi:hypothetical protein CBS63078_5276 [Aspergillus niger]|nr:uncharacterized protein BO96DRAFT_415006 [Aspergillus niger CBS 101883]XP_026627222.1 hypothetical protein BDQ94DRAFT_142278 [Aspergillus welwitschiae]KAI2824585.1 hypothetical protein CBS115989_542 [Aspergillus niger]RDH21052.1 hypothetical protein M747DRAFT_295303 [Aspergillus niger ATCC 13496]RDK36842.1 hypothetical protein M752DRAFT_280184 [Aspergillus phoenicis ATCC 13157]KAI2830183.1 hypothetical protein CBS133816_3778 [Aspergillus niger]KAI2850894.1 hypothetical protein CBS11350_148|eukprot:XP_001401483.2 hypothetical protein ANI_1_270184 [Aspergillus niger CBS 513.88]